MRIRIALILALALSLVGAQNFLVVPPVATLPTTGSNVIPFGTSTSFQPGYTYISTIPASMMSLTYTRVRDVAFLPATTGMWGGNTVTIAMGHVPNPLPCPFTFPQVSGGAVTSIGSFTSLTVMYDTALQGPFNFAMTTDMWSPMNINTSGGQYFVWNGINDVAFYITYQNSITSGTGFNGGCRNQSVIPPSRTYATGYNAVTSTACNSTAALFLRLLVEVDNNELTVSQSGPGIGDLSLLLTNISPTAFEGYTLLSSQTLGNVATGPILGIYPDSLTWQILGYPYFPGNPFHFRTGDSGVFPQTPFNAPPGAVSALANTSLDFVCLMLDSGFAYVGRSNVVRFNFQ